jgi:dTDP-4-dehydrorhamnose reductase
MKRILITGTTGQVGSELLRSFAEAGEIVALTREMADLASPEKLRETIREIAPDVILNPAAYTAVDKAESDVELATRVNADAPRVLAEEAKRLGAIFVHYSTDYVFDGSGEKPWTENDNAKPLGVYGATKLEGERAIQEVGGKYLVFRTSWVYGPRGKNFLFTMLRLAQTRNQLSVINDQFGAPTTSIELARATRVILDGVHIGKFGAKDEWSGTFHMTCSGVTSWFGFARAIFDRGPRLHLDRVPSVSPISTQEYPTPAHRPKNSRLSNHKLSSTFGIQLSSWEDALDEVFAELESHESANLRLP